jgi:Transposase DDE domain
VETPYRIGTRTPRKSPLRPDNFARRCSFATGSIYSIFEPHTDLIKRGKVTTPIEFGHKVFLAESTKGLITQYKVLDGNPSDHHHVEPSLEHHKQTFGRTPEVYGADRGFFSEKNVVGCEQSGVKVVCIPRCGGQRTAEREAYEKSAAFKEGQRFRAGIEGRISVLFRGRGMKRCLASGRERFELWVGTAVLANNLMTIAALMNKRTRRKKRKPADVNSGRTPPKRHRARRKPSRRRDDCEGVDPPDFNLCSTVRTRRWPRAESSDSSDRAQF